VAVKLPNKELPRLNLPHAALKLKELDGQLMIFDVLRKTWLICLPEEWVRQHWIHYLINTLQYPAGLIAQEHKIPHYGTKRRADIVAFTRDMKPYLIVECKAPTIAIEASVLEQASIYNAFLRAPYMAVSNGLVHLCASMKNDMAGFDFCNTIPSFPIQ
jgi:hypothetical protein